MWRKLAGKLRNTLTNRTLPQVDVLHKSQSTTEFTAAQLVAQQKLKDSVSSLSKSHIEATVTVEQIVELNNRPLSELSQEQLVLLGNVLYNGIEGTIKPDDKRTLEVWEEAGRKGNVEAKYNSAMMIREGRGTAPNSADAFKRFLELVQEHNISIAQV